MTNIERLHPTLTRAMLIAAAAACAFACLAHLSSYGPSTWSGPVQAAAFGAFGLIFPVFGSAVVVLSLGRIPPGQLFGTLPVWLKVLSVCVVAYVFVDFFVMLSVLPGQPIEQGGAYFLNNHGSLTPISEAAYRRDLMYGARMFSGHAIVFSGIAALVALQVDRVRRGGVPAGVPISLSTRRLGLPPPFSRSLRVKTHLSPAECAERLRSYTTTARALGWTFSRGEAETLAGSVSEAGFRLSLPYGTGSGMVSAAGRFVVQDGAAVVYEVVSFKRWLLFGTLGGIPIMLGAVLIAFHGVSGPFWFLAAGSAVATVVNVGLGLRDMDRLQSNIHRALGIES
jgi:hypothetical protein